MVRETFDFFRFCHQLELVRRTFRAALTEDPYLASLEFPVIATRLRRYVIQWEDAIESAYIIYDHGERYTTKTAPPWADHLNTFSQKPIYNIRQLLRWTLRFCERIRRKNLDLFRRSDLEHAYAVMRIYGITLDSRLVGSSDYYKEDLHNRQEILCQITKRRVQLPEDDRFLLTSFSSPADAAEFMELFWRDCWKELNTLRSCGTWCLGPLTSAQLLQNSPLLLQAALSSPNGVSLNLASLRNISKGDGSRQFEFETTLLSLARVNHRSADAILREAQASLGGALFRRRLHAAYFSYMIALKSYENLKGAKYLIQKQMSEIEEGWRLCEEHRVEILISIRISGRVLNPSGSFSAHIDPYSLERWLWLLAEKSLKQGVREIQQERLKFRFPDFIRDALILMLRLLKHQDDASAELELARIAEELETRAAVNALFGDRNYAGWFYAFLYLNANVGRRQMYEERASLRRMERMLRSQQHRMITDASDIFGAQDENIEYTARRLSRGS